MTVRVVVLGNGKQVRLGDYVRGWRQVAADPPEREYSHGLTGWGPETAGRILQHFRNGMHDRINRHVPGFGQGRKWSHDWQRTAYHDARRLNTPRLVVRRSEITTDDWRERFAARLEKEDK